MNRLYLLFLLLACNSANAQFNDSTFYHLRLNAMGSLNETNSGNAYLLNNGLNFGIKKNDIVLNASTNWLYGKQNSQLSNNDFSSTLNFNLYKTIPHFYYWGLLNYTSSFSLKINHQVQAGLGVAYNIVDRPNFNINLSDGILFDTSNLLADSKYSTYRNSLRLQYKLNINNLLTFEGSNFIQHSLSDAGDYIVRSSNRLGVKLRSWISLTSTLTYNQMTITQRENLNMTYGLTIDRFF